MQTIVDDDVYEWASKCRWHAFNSRGKNYAARTVKDKKVFLHRVILKLVDSRIEGDHIDGNSLNNLRVNLRPATRSQNGCNKGKQINNKSGFKGVSWSKHANKFMAHIEKDRKQYNLGYFFTPEAASAAYREAAYALHGDFARAK